MYYKKIISLLTILLFAFLLGSIYMQDVSRAADSIRTGSQANSQENDSELTRTADWYQQDTRTTAWGSVISQWGFGPDVGIGETGQGYQYYDPMTGTSVSYSTSGLGMGSIPLAIYGGKNSALGLASYGPFVNSNQAVTQPTYGYNTMSSIYGNAFGQNMQYSTAQIDPIASLGISMLGNPLTMGTGLALASLSGAFSGYGLGSSSLYGYPSYGLGYGYSGYGLGYGGYGGYGGYSGYGGYGGYYNPTLAYSGYGGYGLGYGGYYY